MMFENDVKQQIHDLVQRVVKAEGVGLPELAEIAGLNLLEDYAGADLNTIDLSGVALSDGNFKGTNFTGANLSGADLSGANLSGANLSGADLSGANLSGAELFYAILSQANLSGANLSGANLNEVDLREANLSDAKLIRSLLDSANLSHACLKNARLSRTNLNRAELSSADFSGANLSSAKLSYANLSQAVLTGATLEGAFLHHTNLFGTCLRQADLTSADLRNADLRNACLQDTLFNKACVENARFGANLDLSEDTKKYLRERKAIWVKGVEEVLHQWKSLNESDRAWLQQAGRSQDVAANEPLIRHGEQIEALYVVLHGTLGVTAPGGKEIARLIDGEVVGEISFIKDSRPAANVKALDDSVVWSIPRKLLTEKLDRDPAFGQRFNQALACILADRLLAATSSQASAVEQDVTSLDGPTVATLGISGMISGQSLEKLITNTRQRSVTAIAADDEPSSATPM